MTTPTPIETFEDILAAMENNPGLQAAMRQHILDQEFLQLPAIVRELQHAVAQLTELAHSYITATNARLEQMEARLDQMETRMARLEAGQARLEGNVNRLMGLDYERKAARRAGRLPNRHLDLQDRQVIYAVTMPDNNQLPAVLDNAINAGLIDADESDELEEVDIVTRSPREYVVVEASITVDDNDVQRAQERARLLSKAIIMPVQAAVIGAHVLDTATNLAAANHVTIFFRLSAAVLPGSPGLPVSNGATRRHWASDNTKRGISCSRLLLFLRLRLRLRQSPPAGIIPASESR